jgi:hypothetical protein
MIRRVLAPVLTLACIGLAGCGSSSAMAAELSAPTSSETETTTTFAANVIGIRVAPQPESVLIDLSMPAGDPTCARNPQVTNVTEEDGRVYANAVYDSVVTQSPVDCSQTVTATVTLTTADPIGTRPIVVNHQSWALRDGVYARCAADIGCTPPADHCDAAWILAAFNGLDVPRHAGRSVEHCDQTWMIMKVNLNTAVCGAEPRPGCSAPPSVVRFFLRFQDGWWRYLAQTRSGGCAAVLATEPTFPQTLCTDLPATG